MAEKTPKSSGEVVQDAARESVDQWRALNGLPPIDRSKKAREDSPKGKDSHG